MKKLVSFLLIVLIGTTFVACDNNDNVTQAVKNDNLQQSNPLAGTVWVHHPDTDPDSWDWLNLIYSPNFSQHSNVPNPWIPPSLVYPLEVTFHEDGTIRHPFDYLDNYSYLCEGSDIWIIYNFALGGESVLERRKHNLCPVTFDNPYCSTNCQQNYHTPSDRGNDCATGIYRFLGKLNGTQDTMYLRKYWCDEDGELIIERDVCLIKIR